MPHLERSVLSVPGSNWHMIEKAVTTAADLAFIDLEDAVAPNVKVESRQNVIKALIPWIGEKSLGSIGSMPWILPSSTGISSTSWSRVEMRSM